MDGILNIYKEEDFTSFDVVAKLRGILHQKKIGHTGTLDPMAEGVLPVCLGSATKLCETLTDHDKIYETVMILGVTYDTLDVTGKKLTEEKVMSTEQEVISAIKSFVGGYDQIPPMYSAKKVDGVRLYDLARQGKSVERKSNHVDIYEIEILSIELPRVAMRVHCGKGTYIRSLISDIGAKCGCGAAMEKLLRTKVGNFDLSTAIKLSEVEELMKSSLIEEKVLRVDSVFLDKKQIVLPKELSRFVENGNKLIKEDFEKIGEELLSELENGEKVRIYDFEGRFRAVYEFDKERLEMKPFKMFL